MSSFLRHALEDELDIPGARKRIKAWLLQQKELGDSSLMIEEIQRPALTPVPYAVTYTANPRRVLIVEDNLDSVHILAELVKDIGHQVEFAINGYTAIAIALRFQPDFVLLDLGLPGMDGYEVCSVLKYQPGLERTRIIAVTAYGRDEHRVRARAAGCELHLLKPVSPQALFEVLESSLPAAGAK
jgi:CheY-like chemotaxis protein